MSDSPDPAFPIHYYEYASQLVDTALINGPNPGPPPQAYTAWASANGKPISIAEARNKLSHPSATFTDPNGDVQWVGQHPIPAAGPPSLGPYAYPYAPYQPYAAPSLSSAHMGLMTPLEHLLYLSKVAWEAGHRTYRSGGWNKVWLNNGKKPAPYDKSAAKSKGKPKDDIPAPKRLSQAEIDTMVKSAMATLKTVKEHIAKNKGDRVKRAETHLAAASAEKSKDCLQQEDIEMAVATASENFADDPATTVKQGSCAGGLIGVDHQ
ncbi:hypothetical protein JB92DRAFT_2830821 [Gautieria morchelliformis]|nr:hypothetical protein JB92DRAFT_2830821 [Gautieria morchelliformis]